MTKEEYYRIRNEVYKDAGMDKFDFDLMMMRVVAKAVEEEREACVKVCKDLRQKISNEAKGVTVAGQLMAAIRARREQ